MATISKVYERLLDKSKWDFAAVVFNDREPLFLQSTVCTIEVAADKAHLKIHVVGGPHPLTRESPDNPLPPCTAEHFIPIESFRGVSYYNETKIISTSPLRSIKP